MIYLAASAVIALGYSKFYFELPLPNGSVGQLLDLMDYVSNSVMMPFIALLSTILIGWVKSPQYVIGEMERNGETFRRRGVYTIMIRYIAPVMMFVLFLQSTGILSEIQPASRKACRFCCETEDFPFCMEIFRAILRKNAGRRADGRRRETLSDTARQTL